MIFKNFVIFLYSCADRLHGTLKFYFINHLSKFAGGSSIVVYFEYRNDLAHIRMHRWIWITSSTMRWKWVFGWTSSVLTPKTSSLIMKSMQNIPWTCLKLHWEYFVKFLKNDVSWWVPMLFSHVWMYRRDIFFTSTSLIIITVRTVQRRKKKILKKEFFILKNRQDEIISRDLNEWATWAVNNE